MPVPFIRFTSQPGKRLRTAKAVYNPVLPPPTTYTGASLGPRARVLNSAEEIDTTLLLERASGSGLGHLHAKSLYQQKMFNYNRSLC